MIFTDLSQWFGFKFPSAFWC